MIGGKKTTVTPLVDTKEKLTINPQSGPVTEPQKVPKWIYIEAERIQNNVNVKTIVKSRNNGQLSIFRTKIK